MSHIIIYLLPEREVKVKKEKKKREGGKKIKKKPLIKKLK